MRRAVALLASAACVALIAAGCGSSHRRASASGATTPTRPVSTVTAAAKQSTPPSPAAIRLAAERTAAEPGYTATIGARISVAQLGGNDVTAVGDGRFDPATGSGTLNLAVTLPGLLSLAGPLPTQVIVVGSEAYVKVPSDLASEAPGLEPWLEVGLSELGLGDSLSPQVILGQAARDATRTVPDQAARVAIDPRTGLVRAIVLSYSEPAYHVKVRLRFTGFGPEPAAVAPAAGEVGDLASALRQLGL